MITTVSFLSKPIMGQICILSASKLDSKGICYLFSLKFKTFYVWQSHWWSLVNEYLYMWLHLESSSCLGLLCSLLTGYWVVFDWKSCPRISGFVTVTAIKYMWLYKIQFLLEQISYQLPRQNCILVMVQKIWVYLVRDVLLSQLNCLCWHQVMRMTYVVWRMWFRLWDQLEDKLFLSTPLLGTAGWRKDRGRKCGLPIESFGVYSTLILLLS